MPSLWAFIATRWCDRRNKSTTNAFMRMENYSSVIIIKWEKRGRGRERNVITVESFFNELFPYHLCCCCCCARLLLLMILLRTHDYVFFYLGSTFMMMRSAVSDDFDERGGREGGGRGREMMNCEWEIIFCRPNDSLR